MLEKIVSGPHSASYYPSSIITLEALLTLELDSGFQFSEAVFNTLDANKETWNTGASHQVEEVEQTKYKQMRDVTIDIKNELKNALAEDGSKRTITIDDVTEGELSCQLWL